MISQNPYYQLLVDVFSNLEKSKKCGIEKETIKWRKIFEYVYARKIVWDMTYELSKSLITKGETPYGKTKKNNKDR